jgi:hypothetical protein
MAETAYIVGQTYKIQLRAKKDGATWNLASAVVRLYLKDPQGVTRTPASAAVSDATNGVASYTSLANDLDMPGTWHRAWEVIDGAVIQRCAPIQFRVRESP